MNKRRTRKKRSRFPAPKLLALAALCLLGHRLGAEQAIADTMRGLTGLDLPRTLAAFQIGAFPGLTVSEHEIGTVSQDEVDETQPLPAHRSAMRGAGTCSSSFSACSTKISVSARGISTPGPTEKRRP